MIYGTWLSLLVLDKFVETKLLSRFDFNLAKGLFVEFILEANCVVDDFWTFKIRLSLS